MPSRWRRSALSRKDRRPCTGGAKTGLKTYVDPIRLDDRRAAAPALGWEREEPVASHGPDGDSSGGSVGLEIRRSPTPLSCGCERRAGHRAARQRGGWKRQARGCVSGTGVGTLVDGAGCIDVGVALSSPGCGLSISRRAVSSTLEEVVRRRSPGAMSCTPASRPFDGPWSEQHVNAPVSGGRALPLVSQPMEVGLVRASDRGHPGRRTVGTTRSLPLPRTRTVSASRLSEDTSSAYL